MLTVCSCRTLREQMQCVPNAVRQRKVSGLCSLAASNTPVMLSTRSALSANLVSTSLPNATTSDTVCPSCPDSYDTITLGDGDFKSGLQYCKNVEGTERSQLRCLADEDDNGNIVAGESTCGEWSDPILRQNRCVAPYAGDPNCGHWDSYCEDEYSGTGSVKGTRSRVGLRQLLPGFV